MGLCAGWLTDDDEDDNDADDGDDDDISTE